MIKSTLPTPEGIIEALWNVACDTCGEIKFGDTILRASESAGENTKGTKHLYGIECKGENEQIKRSQSRGTHQKINAKLLSWGANRWKSTNWKDGELEEIAETLWNEVKEKYKKSSVSLGNGWELMHTSTHLPESTYHNPRSIEISIVLTGQKATDCLVFMVGNGRNNNGDDERYLAEILTKVSGSKTKGDNQ